MANRQTSRIKIVDLYFGIKIPLRIENSVFLLLVLFSESGSTNLNKQNRLAVRLNCPKDSWIESDLDIVQGVCRHADWLRVTECSGFSENLFHRHNNQHSIFRSVYCIRLDF